MFENFQLKYREELPLVLKNVNAVIKPAEKVSSIGYLCCLTTKDQTVIMVAKRQSILSAFNSLEHCPSMVMIHSIFTVHTYVIFRLGGPF